MTKKPSLKDIARKAGVSVTLVSYVLNNQQSNRINKDTAQRIREAAKKLQYRTNQAAKALKTNKTFTIGLVVADISNPFFSGLARIIEDEASRMNYTVIFGSSDESGEKFSRLLDTFLSRQADGLIIAPPQHSEVQIKYLKKQNTPFVLIDRYFPSVKADYVILDNYQAAYDAVKQLVKTGRRRIGLITYKTDLFHILDRKSGFLAALRDNKIGAPRNRVREVGIHNNKEEIEKAVHELLYASKPVDAIVFASNIIATHATRYINTLPIKVPDMLSLVGFDEIDSLDLFYAPLSYIKQPLREIGQTAISILLEKMRGNHKPAQVSLKGELVLRQST